MGGVEDEWGGAPSEGVGKVKEDLFMSVYDIGTEQHFFWDFYWS